MLFNKKYLNEIFAMVEELHKKPFWQAFILCVDEHLKHNITTSESGASEYELYFNYMFKTYNNDIIIRNLNWSNISSHTFKMSTTKLNYDYVSVCSWMG